jgi:hypothetical protein
MTEVVEPEEEEEEDDGGGGGEEEEETFRYNPLNNQVTNCPLCQ